MKRLPPPPPPPPPPNSKSLCVADSSDDNSVLLSSTSSSSDYQPCFDLENSADIHPSSSSEFDCDPDRGSANSLTTTNIPLLGSSTLPLSDSVSSDGIPESELSSGSESILCSSSDSQSQEGDDEDCRKVSELKHIFEMESVSSSPAIANVILMSIIKKHHLTYACQADILNLLSIFCPSSAIPSSLNRYYVYLKKDVVMHYCCGA